MKHIVTLSIFILLTMVVFASNVPLVIDPGCSVTNCVKNCLRVDQGYSCYLYGVAEHYDNFGNELPVTLNLSVYCWIFDTVLSCNEFESFSGNGTVSGSAQCFINTGPFQSPCYSYQSSCSCSGS